MNAKEWAAQLVDECLNGAGFVELERDPEDPDEAAAAYRVLALRINPDESRVFLVNSRKPTDASPSDGIEVPLASSAEGVQRISRGGLIEIVAELLPLAGAVLDAGGKPDAALNRLRRAAERNDIGSPFLLSV